MKKILCSLLAIFLLFACKKEKGPGNQPVLSKIFEDGLLKEEFIYSTGKKPLRRNTYNTTSGQSVLSSFTLYQYSPAGLLEEVIEFSKNHLFINKYTLQYDAANRLTRLNDHGSNNDVQFYYLFDYNTAGRVISHTLYNASTLKKNSEQEFGYDMEGNISYTARWNLSGAIKTLSDSATYVFDKNSFPAWWSHFELLPAVALPNGEKFFYEMNLNSLHYRFVNAPPVISDFTFTGKTYNNEGLLIKQSVTVVVDNGFGTSTNTIEKTYEYME